MKERGSGSSYLRTMEFLFFKIVDWISIRTSKLASNLGCASGTEGFGLILF